MADTINLGDRARDRISGFIGIVTGRSLYLVGCDHLQLSPETLSDKGDRRDSCWFDAPQLELVDVGAVPPESLIEPDTPATKRGGPSLFGYSK